VATAEARARALYRACHPEPSLAVSLVAVGMAQAAGADPYLVGLAVLSGQLTTGWTNDWLDRDRDVATGRTDKPVVRGEPPAAVVGQAAALAGLACVPLSLALGLAAGVVHLVAVASAFAYNAWLKATWASWAPYALSFGLLPSVVTLSAADQRAPWWAAVAGALLGVGAHLANALPDLEGDVATGVRGLPHRLGARWSAALSALLLLAATVVLAVGPEGEPGRLGWAAVGVAAAVTATGLALARRPGARTAFLAAIVVAVVDVALLLARGADLV
jgi:4-hydroxybenzoate polyprenyltransferase